MRAKLFISELRQQADKTRNNGSYKFSGSATPEGRIKITEKTDAFVNKWFNVRVPGDSDKDIHPEWVAFASHFASRIANKTQDNIEAAPKPTDLSNKILAIIRSVGVAATNGTEQQFTQELIRSLFFKIEGTTGGAVDIGNVTTWKDATKFTYKVADNLRLLFSDARPMKQLYDVTTAATADVTTIKEFGYKYDAYWLKTLIGEHVESATQSISPSKFFDEDVAGVNEVYFRKGSELFTRDATGKEIRVDTGSPAFQALKYDDKCFGSGVKGTVVSGETCADYLRDCLSGKGVEKCKIFLLDANFWDIAQTEVDAMLPKIAVTTLKAFEFPMEEVWDNTANRRLLKFKSVTAWSESLGELTKTTPQKMTVEEVGKIVGNTKLIGYLHMLVKKVNSSPSILNKDYTGLTDSSKINDPNAFAGTKLHKMGVKARLSVPNLSVSSVERLGQAIKDSQANISITLGQPGLFGSSSRFTLSGGGYIEELETKISDKTKHTSEIIEGHYMALIQRLQKFGKEISKSDTEKIKKLIENLRSSEVKLYKATLYTEKYTKLLETHGQKDNTAILSIDHLKQFVDNRNKYFERVSKKQNDLISIIKSIAEAVNKEAPSTSSEMTSIDVDPKTVNLNSLLG